jgi:hypothetical protein
MIIRKEVLDYKFIQEFNEEFEDLILLLHQDDSTSELHRVEDKFSQPIAHSMPMLCQLHSLLMFDEDEYEGINEDEIIIRVVKDRGPETRSTRTW